MGGRMSRTKGSRGEREVAEKLRENGFEASRNARNGISGMAGGQDISHSLDGYWIEVKRAEKWSLPAWIRQAERDAGDEEVPLVVFRSSRQPWRVVLDFDKFLELMREAKGV